MVRAEVQCNARAGPSLRLFGVCQRTRAKTCVHLHDALPYVYLALVDRQADVEALRRALDTIHRRVVVHSIEVVDRVPAYGYHSTAQVYAKIRVLDPYLLKDFAGKVADHEEVLPRHTVALPVRVCEAHIPYTMQVFADYGIWGMTPLRFSSVRHRQPAPPGVALAQCSSLALKRVSVCALEVDVSVEDLVVESTGQAEVASIHRLMAQERQGRLDAGLASQPEEEHHPRVEVEEPPASGYYRDMLLGMLEHHQVECDSEDDRVLDLLYDLGEVEQVGQEDDDTDEDDKMRELDEAFTFEDIQLSQQEEEVVVEEVQEVEEEQGSTPVPQHTQCRQGSVPVLNRYTPRETPPPQSESVPPPPTPIPTPGYTAIVKDNGGMSIVSMEMAAMSRGTLLPDPEHDAVVVVVCWLWPDSVTVHGATRHDFSTLPGGYSTEADLFESLIQWIGATDPDLLLGFETQKASWGYLAQRYGVLYPGHSFSHRIGRLVYQPPAPPQDGAPHTPFTDKRDTGVEVPGRVVFNLWRLLRSEIKLPIYTYEHCVRAVLGRTEPKVRAEDLTRLLGSAWAGARARARDHVAHRGRSALQLVDRTALVSRTAELSRLFGVPLEAVVTRGSQYRVEALLSRAARRHGMVLASPTAAQVAGQRAMECVPLVMEPHSGVYHDPVAVLDFTSLYPSVMLAHNICYSTCLGRVGDLLAPRRALGVAVLPGLPAETLREWLAADLVWISANGVAFVRAGVRRGLLPRILGEILAARALVKHTLAEVSDPAVVSRMHDQQLGLKLLANVTYGYTAAGFSGRMPCAEVADAIVQTGRQMLERGVQLVESSPEWGARVVYGDTDSVFVLLAGVSRAEAFLAARALARLVTAQCPAPMQLKFEKVYLPCALLTKKRYVGLSYTHESDRVPVFDDKGIETVRRDGCPALAKSLRLALDLVFGGRVPDLRTRLARDFHHMLAGEWPLQDFVFAKEVKLGTYTSAPPAAVVAARAMARDPRAEPLYAERVPYVVVCGHPGARLLDLVVSPDTALASDALVNAVYYIRKQILPALARVLSLVGVDVWAWFATLPRPRVRVRVRDTRPRSTLDQYYASRHCVVCSGACDAALCAACQARPAQSTAVLQARGRVLEQERAAATATCSTCWSCASGGGGALFLDIECCNGECPQLFRAHRVHRALAELHSH